MVMTQQGRMKMVKLIKSNQVKKMKVNIHSKMELYTEASGKAASGTVSESNLGPMAPATRVNGRTTRRTDAVSFTMSMVMCSMASGSRTKRMVLALISM